MKNYTVKVTRQYTYEVPIMATDEDQARNLARGLEVEEIEEYETSAFWDFEFGELVKS